MIKFDYTLLFSIFLSVMLLTGTLAPGFLLQNAFANPFVAVASGSWFDPAVWGGAGPGNVGPGVAVTIPAGITVTIPSEVENSGTITNQGTLVIQNGIETGLRTIFGGSIINSGTINIVNTGNGNGIQLGSPATAGTLTNSGNIFISMPSVGEGISVRAFGSITNSGVISVANTAGTGLANFGTISNTNSILVKCGGTYSGTIGGNAPINQCVLSISGDQDTLEGNIGDAPLASFTVSLLDSAHTMPITVNYQTANDVPTSATAGTDYITILLTPLTFAPGMNTQTIQVTMLGDDAFEPDETFRVSLSGASGAPNAAISTTAGFAIGKILNDDVSDILPDAVDDIATTNEDAAITTNVLGNDPSVGDVPFTITSTDGTKGTTTVNPDNTITYVPNPDQNGPDLYQYTITDTDGDSDTAQVALLINPINDPPTANPDSYSIDEDATLVITPPGVLGNDSDPDGDVASVALVDDVSHGTLILETTGNFAYVPTANYHGIDTFTYKAYDDESESATVTVAITINPINDIPTANNGNVATQEDLATTIALSGADIDGDLLNFGIVSAPTNGALGTLTMTGPTSATITYAPNPNFNGADSIAFVANDGAVDSDVATISITVTPLNDPPQANDDTASTPEDIPIIIDVLSNDVDVDIDDTKTLVSVTNGATGGAAVSGNSVLYTPTPDFAGTDTFSYVMSDSAGAQSSAIVTVMIDGENDAPIALDDNYSMSEDDTLDVSAPGVLENDSDVDSQILSAHLVTPPSHAFAFNLNSDGSFSYVPSPNYYGPDTFTYQANDGLLNSGVATVTILITPVNDPPIANDNTADTTEDASPISIDVLDNDVDIEGDTLIIIAVSDPANGVATTDGTTVSYAPDVNYNGPDLFTYTISDGNGGQNTTQVLITVFSVNDPPIAVDDVLSTSEDISGMVNVVANDSDPEDATITVTSVDMPLHGTAIQSGTDSITYTPNANYFGPDSFIYTITDSSGAPATAIVAVTVTPINDIPVALPDSYTVDEDQSLTVTMPGILENDSDVETMSLNTILVSTPAHGALGLFVDGSFTYTPNANYFGPDSFTYRASDGTNTSDITTVSITINSINDLPIATGDSATTPHNTPVTIPVLDNDSDIEGPLSVLSVATPTSGTATITGNFITYTPNAGFSGNDIFSYGITDGADQASATITVTVTDATELYCGLPESSYNVIDGSPFNDNLVGTNDADLIRGYGGDDKIKGKKGNDCLIGGDGSDKIWGGDGHDTIQGNAGNDRLYGDKDDDTIYGNDGNDKLWGGKGDDLLYGEIGYDRLHGGDGNDSMYGGDHNDKIFGGKGNDTIDAGAGNDEVHANQGNDAVFGGPGDDWLGAGNGNDTINAGDGNDKLFGRDGADALSGEGDDDQIFGGSGNDTIDGGETPNPSTDNDRCLGGSGANSIVNCEATRGGYDDYEESRHDENEGESEEPES